MEGNEREYWLDSIYEEALSIRESYCTSVRSAAFALQHAAKNGSGQKIMYPAVQQSFQPNHPAQPDHHYQQQQPLPTNGSSPPSMSTQFATSPQQQLEPKHPPTPVDASQSPPMIPPGNQKPLPEPTNSMPSQQQAPKQKQAVTPEGKPMGKPSAPSDNQQKPAPASQQQPKEQPEVYESADSALPQMIIGLFSLFFSIVWFFFIKLPYRICSSVLTFCFIITTCRLLWLLLADDNGAWEMGAGVDYEFNAPGIY